MRIAIYARKSTESEDRQVQSLDDQLQILHDLAAREPYEVVEVITEAKSAKEPNQRAGFNRLLQLIEEDRIEGILTWHINRLTRNLVDGGTLAHLLSSGRLRLIRTPDRSYRPEDNVLLLAIENGMATSYIHDLRRAVRRGMDSKAQRGWKPGQAPLGYINNWETREIDLDPVRAPLVRKAWDMLLTGGYSVEEVADHITKLGLTRKGKRSMGKPLSRTGWHNLFRNPFYTGSFLYRGTLTPGKHAPLVTRAEFELAQSLIARTTLRRSSRQDWAAFSGIFTCAKCGCAVVFERKQKRLASTGETATYDYYHCSGMRGCQRASVSSRLIADQALKFADRVSISPSFAAWCEGAIAASLAADRVTNSAKNEELTLRIRAQTERLDSLTLKFVDSEITRDVYHRLKSALEAQIAEDKAQHTALANSADEIAELVKSRLDAMLRASNFAAGNTQYRREILLAVGSDHKMEGKAIHFRPDPVIEKIASFEPGSTSSQSIKSSDFSPDSRIWWTLVDDIRSCT